MRPGGKAGHRRHCHQPTPQSVRSTDLWGSCRGGAARAGHLPESITDNTFSLERVRKHDYGFLSNSAGAATAKYGVMSLSILAPTTGTSA